MASSIEEYRSALVGKKQGDLINELITLRLEGPPQEDTGRILYHQKVVEIVSLLNIDSSEIRNGVTNEHTKSGRRPKVKSLKSIL